LITRHSQEQIPPECPPNTIKLWDGYSLLYFSGNEKSHQQDLGSAGSCLKFFSVMPFIRCDINNVCNFAQNNDLSYWLSTTLPIPKAPMVGQDIKQYISRCSVCEAPSNVIAVHSQTENIPNCPANWVRLWDGYSFVMHRGSGAEGGGQSLQSPGSCLEGFRTTPFIECNAMGKCQFTAQKISFWLSVLADYDQFNMPRMITTEEASKRQKISRCRVCMKNSSSKEGQHNSLTFQL